MPLLKLRAEAGQALYDLPDARPVPLPPGNCATNGTFLVDGYWQGTWKFRHDTLRLQPFTKLARTDRDALLTEAAALCTFLDPRVQPQVMFADDRVKRGGGKGGNQSDTGIRPVEKRS